MKPEWNEVYQYGEKRIKILLARKYTTCAAFQKQEMAQEARIRVWQAYESIEEGLGWKSFVSTHIGGAMLDYLRSGSGFIEDKTASSFMCRRIKMYDRETGKELDVEDSLGICGVFSDFEESSLNINWKLLSHLASREDAVLILAKNIMGFSMTEIAEDSRLSRERVHQQVGELIAKFDDPVYKVDKWINQIVFAFGLAEYFGTPNKDNGWGWELAPVDLFDRVTISNKEFSPQLDFLELA